MTAKFTHSSLGLTGERPIVFTAISKHYFYYRMFISKYVLEQGKVPLNPFMLFDYFLLDAIDRDSVREANNSLIKRADELWVFGPVSNGVLAEIKLAKGSGKPIMYFGIRKPHEILPIPKSEVEMEEEVKSFKSEL